MEAAICALGYQKDQIQIIIHQMVKLIKDGEEIGLEHWALSILDEMDVMYKTLGIGNHSILSSMRRRIVDPNLTYGKRLAKLVKEEGYIYATATEQENTYEKSLRIIYNLFRKKRFKSKQDFIDEE